MWCPVESAAGAGAGGAAPCGRGKHAAAVLGGHVYVLGGRGAGGALPLRDFWRYSLLSGRWERLQLSGEPPPSLQEHSAVAHGTSLYVFGGEASATSSETPLWIYDTESEVWRKVPGAGEAPARAGRRRRGAREAGGPRGRRGHSAHCLNDCLLIYGGYKDLRGSTNELWAFHYESESWHLVRTQSEGPARHRHAAALHDNRLYVHAGRSDLRACADLWHYDLMSRVWSQVRVPAKLAPSARSGHAGLRAGAHFYIFGGEAAGHPTNELWRFHFATETWERIVQSLSWPSARVDGSALVVRRVPPARPAPTPAPALTMAPARAPAPPASLLREISKLSTLHMRRGPRCAYAVLGERDSTESLPRSASLAASRSEHQFTERQPADGLEAPAPDLAREPISVPDFADMVLPTPVLSPVEATKLVYLDSEEEEDARRGRPDVEPPAPARRSTATVRNGSMPKSASVRFTENSVTMTTEDDETELSTSDYASAERVNRLSGFCNPHYLGPDVRKFGVALTPDSGVGAGDIELQDLGGGRGGANGVSRNGDSPLHLLVVGGREPHHPALMQSSISMWTYRLQ